MEVNFLRNSEISVKCFLMVKKLAILGLLGIAILAGYLIYGNSKKEATKILGSNNSKTKAEVKTDEPTQINLTYGGQDLTVSWYKLEPIENLTLIPNYDSKLTSDEAIKKYNCKFLGNAGFYSKEGKPIGLFVSDGEKISSWQKNDLLNGIFSINSLLTPRITQATPEDPLQIAIQSGPLIKENAAYKNITSGNNNYDRRMLLAVTGENKAIFLAIYNHDSVFLGPKLSEVPEIIKLFERRLGIIFADVINLDGGSASAFKTKDFSLPEATNVGSFFCLKNPD